MGRQIIKIKLGVTKLEVINFKSQKCSNKEPENPKEEGRTCRRVASDWFWAVKDRKSDNERKNRGKKWSEFSISNLEKE